MLILTVVEGFMLYGLLMLVGTLIFSLIETAIDLYALINTSTKDHEL